MYKDEINNYIEKLDITSNDFDLEFETEMIQMRFMSEVERLMDENKISKSKLSKLIGTSASFITQLFQGNKKLNLETIAKFQYALDYKFKIDAVKDVSRPLSYLGYDETENNIFDLFNYKKMSVLKNKVAPIIKDNYQNAV